MKWYSEFLKERIATLNSFYLTAYMYPFIYLFIYQYLIAHSPLIADYSINQFIFILLFIYLHTYIFHSLNSFLFLTETTSGYILRHKQMAAEHALDTHHGPVSCSYSLTSCNKVLHRPSASICNVAQTWSRHDPFCRLKNWMIDWDKGFSLAWMCSLGEIKGFE